MDQAELSSKEALFQFIDKRRYVSFVEITRRFEWAKGELFLKSKAFKNIVLWCNLSEEAIDAIIGLLDDKRIFLHPTSPFLYVVDGEMLALPIAKRSRDYTKPHWCVATLCTFPPKWKNLKGRHKI